MSEPWWAVRERRLAAAVATLRSKEIITVVESIFSCKIENDIPGLDIIQRDDAWGEYFEDPANTADIYLNQGYDHDLSRLWKITKSMRVGVTACWFWDNHHLYKTTMRAAMLSDVAFFAHAYASNYENELGHDGGFVPLCGTFWSRTLVEAVLKDLAGRPRLDHLYGGFNCYPEFAARDTFILRCMEQVPLNHLRLWANGLRRAEHGYYSMSHEEKLREWCGYKVCLCVSFGSNTTMRIFEALVCGQIPIVVGDIADLPRIFTSDDEAMLPIIRVVSDNVEAVVDAHSRALQRFDVEGQAGVERRSRYALARHMPSNRLVQMVEAIKGLPAQPFPSDAQAR